MCSPVIVFVIVLIRKQNKREMIVKNGKKVEFAENIKIRKE